MSQVSGPFDEELAAGAGVAVFRLCLTPWAGSYQHGSSLSALSRRCAALPAAMVASVEGRCCQTLCMADVPEPMSPPAGPAAGDLVRELRRGTRQMRVDVLDRLVALAADGHLEAKCLCLNPGEAVRGGVS